MKKHIIQLAGIAMLLLVVSCKKEDGDGEPRAVFSYVADGFVVSFTNFSTDATEYLWDFGDGTGETSARKSPQYIYKAKGDYLVSLTVKNGDITSTFTDTVSIIGPNIKIDGDFTDWEFVAYTYINNENEGGTLRAVKTFASRTHLNFLLEGTADMNLEVLMIYLDTDDDPATGYDISWLYPLGSGTNYKLEGSMVGMWGSLAKHSGVPADGWGGFSEVASFTLAIAYSEIKATENGKAVEFAIDRSLLGNLSGSINYGIIDNSSGYQQMGAIPANGNPDAKFAAFPL